MAKGSSAPASPQTQVVKQETIPAWLQPYVTDVAKRGQAISQEAYQPYKGTRTASFDPMERTAFRGVSQLRSPEELNRASRTYGQIAGGSGGFRTGRTVGQVGEYGDVGRTRTGRFNERQAARYMSPYQQAVTDVAIRKAQEEATRQGGIDQLGAAGRGSAGGSRSAIMDAMRMRGLTDTVGDLQARGSQDAFTNAQLQFERDRAARMTGFERDRAADMTAFERDRAARMGALERDRAAGMTQAERDRQARIAAAQGLVGVGAMEQRLDLQRLAAQKAAGAEQRGRTQSIYDQRYADFLRQRDYPKEQLGWYSNIVRGLPAGLASSAITYGREPSFGQQAAGLGITGLGAYNLLKG